jgi:hypothetical protein
VNEVVQPSARYSTAAHWWVATELMRRNQHLALIETYPMEGFYDCLTLLGDSTAGRVHIDFNRRGRIHVHPDHIGLISTADIVGHEDAHWAVKEIERAAGLAPSDKPPVSTGRLVTLRLMARVVNYLVNDRSDWTLRVMSLERDGYAVPLIHPSAGDDSPLPGVFPSVRVHHAFFVASGLPDEFEAGRFWALQRDGIVVAVFDTRGFVHTKHAQTALRPLYARVDRNLTQTMMIALADVLP